MDLSVVKILSLTLYTLEPDYSSHEWATKIWLYQQGDCIKGVL